MSNYSGMIVRPVFVKLFAVSLESSLASWAGKHGVKARGQAGFHKINYTTVNIHILKLIDKQRQARLRGKSGKLYCCFADFQKACNIVPHAVTGARRPGCCYERYEDRCKRKTAYYTVKVVLNKHQWLEERYMSAQPRKGISKRVA